MTFSTMFVLFVVSFLFGLILSGVMCAQSIKKRDAEISKLRKDILVQRSSLRSGAHKVQECLNAIEDIQKILDAHYRQGKETPTE